MAVKANVLVTLKPGVLDPQGQAVKKTLDQLGFAGLERVRIGKLVEIEFADGASAESVDQLRATVVAMCEKLLCNPVIEDFQVDICEDAERSE